MLVLLVLGAAGGFPLGRWTAEYGRARHDMNKVWDNRTAYREKN
jgi:hypothetical protein